MKEVVVLQRGSSLLTGLHIAIYGAALQVKHELDAVWVLEVKSVLHQHDVNFAHLCALDCEYAKNLGNQAVWVLLVVLGKGW